MPITTGTLAATQGASTVTLSGYGGALSGVTSGVLQVGDGNTYYVTVNAGTGVLSLYDIETGSLVARPWLGRTRSGIAYTLYPYTSGDTLMGMKLAGTGGVLQVDDLFRNLEVVSEATYSGGAGIVDVFFSSNQQTSAPPLIFVQTPTSAEDVGNAMLMNYNGGSPLPGPPWDRCILFTTGAFSYKVLGIDNQPSPSGSHGVQVFDPAAVRIFDSRQKYAAIKSYHTQGEVSGSARVSITIPDQGQRPWFLVNYLGIGQRYADTVGTPGWIEQYISCRIVNNTTLELICRDRTGAIDPAPDYAGPAPLFDPFGDPIVMMSAKF